MMSVSRQDLETLDFFVLESKVSVYFNGVNKIQQVSEIWTSEIQTCLKSELLLVQISDTLMCLKIEPKSSVFRHSLKKYAENQMLSSDFRQCWKPNSYWVSEIHTRLDFRHTLKALICNKKTQRKMLWLLRKSLMFGNFIELQWLTHYTSSLVFELYNQVWHDFHLNCEWP